MATSLRKKKRRSTDESPSSPAASFGLVKCPSTAAASKFMVIVSDDVLVEILLRLPDSRSVIRCATVCKHWHSLIIKNPNFIPNFIQYHPRKNQYWDFWTLFNYEFKNNSSFYQIPSVPSKWKPYSKHKPYMNSAALFNCLYGTAEPFRQAETDLVAKHYQPRFSRFLKLLASWDDLLLATLTTVGYYICNARTFKWIELPKPPLVGSLAGEFRSSSFGYALVRDRGSFRVVVIHGTRFAESRFTCYMSIFDFETGLWAQTPFSVPCEIPRGEGTKTALISHEVVVSGNGILHWLDGNLNFYGVVVFDPFKFELGLLPLPEQLVCKSRTAFKYRLRLGIVRGRVRLSEMVEIGVAHFNLKVWEFDSRIDSWISVHDVTLETRGFVLDWIFFVLAFHPGDGNVVFLVRGDEVCRYEVDKDKYERVCKFPRCAYGSNRMKNDVATYFKVITLVHPAWPTPIPSFASAPRVDAKKKRRVKNEIQR